MKARTALKPSLQSLQTELVVTTVVVRNIMYSNYKNYIIIITRTKKKIFKVQCNVEIDQMQTRHEQEKDLEVRVRTNDRNQKQECRNPSVL